MLVATAVHTATMKPINHQIWTNTSGFTRANDRISASCAHSASRKCLHWRDTSASIPATNCRSATCATRPSQTHSHWSLTCALTWVISHTSALYALKHLGARTTSKDTCVSMSTSDPFNTSSPDWAFLFFLDSFNCLLQNSVAEFTLEKERH